MIENGVEIDRSDIPRMSAGIAKITADGPTGDFTRGWFNADAGGGGAVNVTGSVDRHRCRLLAGIGKTSESGAGGGSQFRLNAIIEGHGIISGRCSFVGG